MAILTQSEQNNIIKIAEEKASLEWCAEILARIDDDVASLDEETHAITVQAVQKAYLYGYIECLKGCSKFFTLKEQKIKSNNGRTKEDTKKGATHEYCTMSD